MNIFSLTTEWKLVTKIQSSGNNSLSTSTLLSQFEVFSAVSSRLLTALVSTLIRLCRLAEFLRVDYVDKSLIYF